MKVARFKTKRFRKPNCEGLNRRSVRQLTELLRHQSGPKPGVDVMLNIGHLNGRAAETPEQSQARRLQHATYMASQRDTETIEAAESRKRAVAERAQHRRLIFTKNTWGYSIKLLSIMTKLLITKATSL
ncbi:hypothetical protein TNCV_3888441 [Trichonephila clavipes]|nr:hypothetical protein TNCV_3888441 [Trichonephila clavipes]